MTNEGKARTLLGVPIKWTFNYWLAGFRSAEQKELQEKRNLLMQMAEWKDQQFKEYLGNTVKAYKCRGEGFFKAEIKAVEKIIDELFGDGRN